MADPAARRVIGRARGRTCRGPYVVFALCLLGCSEDAAKVVPVAGAASTTPPPHARRVSLVDHRRWVQLGPADDPFDDRPRDVTCADGGVAAEELAGELAYGVDTGPCSYVTAQQLTQQHVSAGETVVVRLWHFALMAPDAGEAHAVVDVGGLRLLDERVTIPAPGGLIRVEALADRSVAAGAPVLFHLHNHGENSWALVEVSTGP